MNTTPIAVRATGLVSAVGLSAAASCAAFRAKLSNPSETRFSDASGEWVIAHQVPLPLPWRGVTKLAKMAAMAIDEAMAGAERGAWSEVPILLCTAERERPGRIRNLDEHLHAELESELGATFHPSSAQIARGRVGVAVALAQARKLVYVQGFDRVLIVAADGLIGGATLDQFESDSRLLTANNSNGFMPGEGAGALLVGRPNGNCELLVTGLGFAVENATIMSDEPLRADGLAKAIRAALSDAGLQMHELDYRIADLSGEHYYFKEAALAVSRVLRQRKEEFDLWHPAECTGEVGATAGVSVIAWADAAARKGYAKGPAVLAHWAADSGHRAVATLQWREG